MSAFLACGVAGTELDGDERRLLSELRPGGVVLFARNVVDREQLAALVRRAARACPPARTWRSTSRAGG